MGKIIVVEDDADVREEFVSYLALSGFDVAGVGSAAELYRRMAVERFSILVLDLRLPDEDGLSIAAYVRANSSTGIIMVTAHGGDEDRLRGREAGADIYLAKPIDLRELVAAIQNLESRLSAGPSGGPRPAEGWRLDVGRFALAAPDGREAHVSANELALLKRLTSPCGVVVPRGDLLAQLGYDPNDPSNRNLDAALRRLRLKVEDATGRPLPLRTIHSVGYVMSAMVRVAG